MEFDQIKGRSKTRRCRKCRQPAWSPVKLACVSAVKRTGTEPGPESPGIATAALLAEARGIPVRQLFRQARADLTVVFKQAFASRTIHLRGRRRRGLPDGKGRSVYTVRGRGFARAKTPGFVFPTVQLERPRMIADGS